MKFWSSSIVLVSATLTSTICLATLASHLCQLLECGRPAMRVLALSSRRAPTSRTSRSDKELGWNQYGTLVDRVICAGVTRRLTVLGKSLPGWLLLVSGGQFLTRCEQPRQVFKIGNNDGMRFRGLKADHTKHLKAHISSTLCHRRNIPPRFRTVFQMLSLGP